MEKLLVIIMIIPFRLFIAIIFCFLELRIYLGWTIYPILIALVGLSFLKSWKSKKTRIFFNVITITLLISYAYFDYADTVRIYYPNGQLHIMKQSGGGQPGENNIWGKSLEYYPNGKLRFKGRFSPRPIGIHTWWDPNGKVLTQIKYVNGHPEDGEVIMKFDDGKVQSTAHYMNGKHIGEFIEYNSNGVIQENSFYPDTPTGWTDYPKKRLTFYESGKPKSDETLMVTTHYSEVKCNPVPPSTFWYENGKKQRELAGTLTGDYVDANYYPDGKLKSKKIFKEGHEMKEISWYENGKKATEKDSDGTELNIKYYEWDTNGSLKRKLMFSNGKEIEDK